MPSTHGLEFTKAMKTVLFLCLSVRSWRIASGDDIDHDDVGQHCSREDSRVLNKYFSNHIYTELKVDPEELPQNCPFHPAYNIFRSQEAKKTKVSRSEWKCGFCGKRFKSEFYLDRHMTNKHVDKLDTTRTTTQVVSQTYVRC
jgi:hypothetical protein